MSWDLSTAKPPVVVDTTLRDGSHAHRHQYTVEEARAIAQALDEAGVYAIEVSHGDGLGGSSLQYGFSRTDEMELIRAVRETVRRAKVAALLLPGIGTRKELKEAVEAGIQICLLYTSPSPRD